MQHNRFRICPMQRYLCFRIILLQVQIRQANNVRHLFSPLLQSRASRASRVRGFSFYMARCSRLWRISVLSALLGQRPEPIRDSGFFFFLSLAARAEPRRLFRSLFTHENNPDILLIGKMFGLFVLTVRIGFNDGK